MVKKCKTGYQRVGSTCKRIRNRIFRVPKDGVTQPNKNVRYIALFTFVVLALILIVNIDLPNTVKPLAISIVFIIGSLIFYSIKELQDDLSGLRIKSLLPWTFVGIIFAVAFHLVTRFVPFLSLAYPVYPASIGGGLKSFLINFVSPLTESLFFVGGTYALMRNFVSKRGHITTSQKYTIIFLVSLLFSIFHLGAYVVGIYALDISQATTAVISNITSFVSAFSFMFLSLTVGMWRGVDKSDQSFFISSHAGVNILRTAFSVIKFVV